MAYQALYRQWRSKTFSQQVGQDTIIATLTRQVMTGRISHAYLFSGTRGTGKTSTAQIFARAVNCLHPQEGNPCGVCENCMDLERGISLDVEEIDAASNNGVDEIRSLRDKIRYPPQSCRYRVYIIDEVHMLSASAFNALLKTLEEPPAHAVLILATTEPQRLPATILSRCQRFDFKRIPAAEIAGRLRQAADGVGVEYDGEALLAIARAAEGGMRDALSMLDVCIAQGARVTLDAVEAALGSAGRAFVRHMVDALARGEAGEALLHIDRAMKDGRDAAVLARDLCAQLRNVLLALAMSGEDAVSVLEISPEEAAELKRQGELLGAARTARALDIVSRLEPEMRWAAHPRTLLELAVARVCRPEAEMELDALLQRVATLEAQLKEGSFVIRERKAEDVAAAKEKGEEETKRNPPAHPPTGEKGAAPSVAPAADNAAAVWKTASAAVRKASIPLYMTAVKRARLASVQGSEAVIAFAPEDRIYCDMLNAPNNLEIVTKALSEAVGRTLSVKAVLSSGDMAEVETPAVETFVDDVISVFGRENVEIREKEGDEL